MAYRFTAELWLHTGGSWHFVTLPHEQTDEIDEITASTAGGWGAVRVHVTVGSTTWSTSLFPDSKAESFVLPIKKSVRVKEGLVVGAAVEVSLVLAHHPD